MIKPELKDASNIVLNSSESRSNGLAIVAVVGQTKTCSICISLIYIILKLIVIRLGLRVSK